MSTALILGVTGQDGSYLADLLVEKGYKVHGMYRRVSTGNFKNIQHLLDEGKIILHQGDMADPGSVARILDIVAPDEIYNEADQDHVGWSYKIPGYSMDITAGSVMRTLQTLLDALGERSLVKFFQPVSATMFGDTPPPQGENSKFNPQSPYAIAKLAAYYTARYFREAHGMHIVTAILFNHDSPRRTSEYLLHKICKSAVAIARGEQKTIKLGAPDMHVDIGYAKEYMEIVWELMQLKFPDDWVIGTGQAPTIRSMVEHAFEVAGVDGTVDDLLEIDPNFKRPGNEPDLLADISKLHSVFGRGPQVNVYQLIEVLIAGQDHA